MINNISIIVVVVVLLEAELVVSRVLGLVTAAALLERALPIHVLVLFSITRLHEVLISTAAWSCSPMHRMIASAICSSSILLLLHMSAAMIKGRQEMQLGVLKLIQ